MVTERGDWENNADETVASTSQSWPAMTVKSSEPPQQQLVTIF